VMLLLAQEVLQFNTSWIDVIQSRNTTKAGVGRYKRLYVSIHSSSSKDCIEGAQLPVSFKQAKAIPQVRLIYSKQWCE
jgi:hypothetical protein